MYKLHKQYRLKNYDYSSAGYYFVTICTDSRKWFLGNVKNGEMKLSKIGEIVKDEWLKTPEIRNNVALDEWVIMPNHIHAVVILKTKEGDILDIDCLAGKNRENNSWPASKISVTQSVSSRRYEANHASSSCRNVATLRSYEKIMNGNIMYDNRTEKKIFYSSLSPKSKTLSSIIRSFKSAVKYKCDHAGFSYFSWQPRFHDHIIRIEPELHYIRMYIFNNPANWKCDKNNKEDLFM